MKYISLDSLLFKRPWHPTKTAAEAFYFWAQPVLSQHLSFHYHLRHSQLTRWLSTEPSPTNLPKLLLWIHTKRVSLAKHGALGEITVPRIHVQVTCAVSYAPHPQRGLHLRPWHMPLCLGSTHHCCAETPFPPLPMIRTLPCSGPAVSALTSLSRLWQVWP
jgi:hypothetical protein